MSSPEQHRTPDSGSVPKVSRSSSDQTNGERKPTGIESLRTRFNPRLIGFGIVKLSTPDWSKKELSSQNGPGAVKPNGRYMQTEDQE